MIVASSLYLLGPQDPDCFLAARLLHSRDEISESSNVSVNSYLTFK